MIKEDKIRKLAHRFYVLRALKEGHALDDWLKAKIIICWQERIKACIKHPLFLLVLSGIIIFLFQRNYIKNEENLKLKYDILKKVSYVHTVYYQEMWNEWYAFRDKTSSEQYRKNIQNIVAESNSIASQLSLVFKDKKIFEDWLQFLHIYWEAQYPISPERGDISEENLNKKLNSANPIFEDLLKRIYKEL